AYRDLPKFRELRAFPAWFRKIVFKHCDRRTRRKQVAVIPLTSAAEIAAPLPDPAQVVERQELQAALRAALQSLPERERVVTTLFYINEYSYRDIASFLSVPISTIKNRLHAARSYLREHLMEMLQEELQAHRPSAQPTFTERVMSMLTLAPNQQDHTEAIFTVIGQQWPHAANPDKHGRVTASHYDWNTTRIGMIEDQVVTHFGVYDITMRIGRAQVRTAGVQFVTTDPRQRGQGLMRETAEAAVHAMRTNGYDLSVVMRVADDRLYRTLGYVFAWPENSYTIRTEDLPPDPVNLELQEFTPGHRADLADIYNQENEGVTGTAVRPTFLHMKEPGADRGWLWANAEGRPLGYVIGGPSGNQEQPDTLWHTDSAGDPERRLGVLGMLARQGGYAKVFFDRQPARSILARQLQRYTCVQQTRYRQTGGWLIRVINLRSTLTKLAPELSRRLRLSHLHGWQGNLLISNGTEGVVLHIDGALIQVGDPHETAHAIRGGAEIAQLLIGTAAPDEIVEAVDMNLMGDALELARVLFPDQQPQMCNEDL
ncbi:MAG TPA: GNAT family N-acetyltransferase, partial [Herpetosiphonaceae bacterium]|nr:GNAT family N-acetyltransferase [Herpetosiphonaceae bacterium]